MPLQPTNPNFIATSKVLGQTQGRLRTSTGHSLEGGESLNLPQGFIDAGFDSQFYRNDGVPRLPHQDFDVVVVSRQGAL